MAALGGEKLAEFVSGKRSLPRAGDTIAQLDVRLPGGKGDEKVVRAITACVLGALPEEVAALVDWREFEAFSAQLFRAKGFSVTENIVLSKPRMQIDLLARSPSINLAVDCKHWARGRGEAAMSAIASAQLKRAAALKSKNPRMGPTGAAILVLVNTPDRFVEGAAVVPLYSLFDFLENLDSYREMLRVF